MQKEYTNRHNLPEEIVDALTLDRYNPDDEDLGDYSATTLVAPIQQTILKRRYPADRITRDVTELTWTFFGSLAHACIEQCAKGHGLTEVRLYADVLGKTISGKMDRYSNGEVKDWKFTKVYKWMKKDLIDWELQLNILKYLLETNGYPVTKLTIIMHLRDFSKVNAYKKGYPDCEWQVVPIKIWGNDGIKTWIELRVKNLEEAKHLPDNELPHCSQHEMWQEVKDYALMKDGATRATRVFDTAHEALVHYETLKKKDGCKIVPRLTKRRRCLDSCEISHLCFQNKKLLIEEGGEELGSEQEERPIF